MERQADSPMPLDDPGSDDEFVEWLHGRQELALLGSESRSDFLGNSIEDMSNRGMVLNTERFAVLMSVTFGSLEKLLEELKGMTLEDFASRYPSIAGIVASWHQGSRDVGELIDLPMTDNGGSDILNDQ